MGLNYFVLFGGIGVTVVCVLHTLNRGVCFSSVSVMKKDKFGVLMGH